MHLDGGGRRRERTRCNVDQMDGFLDRPHEKFGEIGAVKKQKGGYVSLDSKVLSCR